MKVYVIYDPLLKKVLCVHQYPDTECPICKSIRYKRSIYFLEEIEKKIYNNAKTYDSPAVLNDYNQIEKNSTE